MEKEKRWYRLSDKLWYDLTNGHTIACDEAKDLGDKILLCTRGTLMMVIDKGDIALAYKDSRITICPACG